MTHDSQHKVLSTRFRAPWVGRLRGGQSGTALTIGLLAAVWIPLAVFGQEPQEHDKPDEQLEKLRAGMSNVPNIATGLAISRKLCSTCHLIGDPPAAATPVDVPSFVSIANRPGQTPEMLTNWLMAPHQPMPDPHLSRLEIRDLTGYILSLQKAK